MTAPARTRSTPAAPTRGRSAAPRRSGTAPAARPAGPARTAAPRAGRTTAAQRAYERRTERTQRFLHLVPEDSAGTAGLRRVPFVALVITLLAAGLVATLWLSTRAAEGSYQLGAAQDQNQLLSERAEALRRDVATADSASALAERAEALGMVPADDVAHLVVGADGAVTVVGTPAPAAGTPGPDLIVAPTTAPAAAAPTTAAAKPAAAKPAAAKPAAAKPAAAKPAPAAATRPGIQPGATPSPTSGGA